MPRSSAILAPPRRARSSAPARPTAPRGPRRAPDPLPELRPMLAVLGTLPPDPQRYAFEFKWDGVRAMCHCDAGGRGGARLQLLARSGTDITARYPELHTLADAIGRPAVLDGEI